MSPKQKHARNDRNIGKSNNEINFRNDIKLDILHLIYNISFFKPPDILKNKICISYLINNGIKQ